jgi:hypothetical protein
MEILVINRYRKLAELGLVKPLSCPRDPTDFNLFAKLDHDDNIILYCISCGWEARLGLNTYDKIAKAVAQCDVSHTN